jgi:hypothetical protein
VKPLEAPGQPSFPIEAAVDRDAVQPGGQRGISPEIADAPIDLQKNLLNDVLALFSVKGDPEGNGKNLFTKTTDQQLKCPFIAALQPKDQFLVVNDSVLYGFRHRSEKKVQSF